MGSYLAELLLDKGYEVHGLVRRSSSFVTGRIDHLYQDPHEPGVRLLLHYSDVTDASSLVTWISRIRPDRGIQPRRADSRRCQLRATRVHGERHGARHPRLLEAVRHADWPVRFYQAGSSEAVWNVEEVRKPSRRRSARAVPMPRPRCLRTG